MLCRSSTLPWNWLRLPNSIVQSLTFRKLMNYIKWFDPDRPASPVRAAGREMGDRTESVPYFYQPDITLAVNVALATQRPLLVSGPSGCGKSTLAADIARVKGWAYEKEVINSRMQATDL